MAITAIFNPATGTLSVFGDALGNTVRIGRNAGGEIFINDGEVVIQGGKATIGNTFQIDLFGLGDNDVMFLDESLGALPRANLFGGTGDDQLTGGSGDDMLFGQSGNDILSGKSGNDFLFGGSEDDVLTGGKGSDQMFGESGDDRMVWNAGDGTDLIEGGEGVDITEVNGSRSGESFTLTANGTRVRFDKLGADASSIDIGTTETFVLNMGGGNDSFSATGNLAALISIIVDGGDGHDTIIGGNGNDVLLGGSGNDFIDGQQGNDVVFLGAGKDTFQWDPGDGSDTVEGQDGADTLLFNASAGSEIFTASANGGRTLFTRNIGNIVMDLDGVETITVNALGGSDTVVVNDLTGTDVSTVNVNLAGTLGGTAGDGAADVVVANATGGDDVIKVNGSGTTAKVSGLAAKLTVTNAEAAADTLIIDGLGGDDTITAANLAAGVIKLTLDGGAGNDQVTGSAGNDILLGNSGDDVLLGKDGVDILLGGSEDDVLTGGKGDDEMHGGTGDDRMIWKSGDGADLMEGDGDIDTAEVSGDASDEAFTLTANGDRVRFDRLGADAGSIDIGTTENFVLMMGGGNDSFSATGNLAALIGITVDGGAGDDTILGGNGNDLLLGGSGSDLIDGQQGNDVAFLGSGNDTFQWDPGDGSDTVEGQDGADTLLFNGSNASEIFTASANGGRTLFTRNVANIVMDLDGVETITLNALGGGDTVIVDSLAGTDVSKVNVNLAGTLGGTAGDGTADVVVGNGTSAKNVIKVTGSGSSVTVTGLAAQLNISNAEGASDSLVIDALADDDTITASNLAAGVIKLTMDGGAGNDTIHGSQGSDVILGGAGNDFVAGDGGDDIALLGSGDDVFHWEPGDGSDTIEGQDGYDTLRFFGSGIAENVNISANGGRVLLLRDAANVTMDLDDVEEIELRAQDGGDNIVVGDLGGTDLTRIDIDLRGLNGDGDGAADSVTVHGSNGADVFGVTGDAGGILVFGLQAGVNVFHAEQANDRLTLNGLGGDDVIDASSLEADGIQLTINGGLGNDIMLGGEGADLVNGGDGQDLALMGAGDDTFVWNPGDDDDSIEGQAGFDTLVFNGSNASENHDIFANGERAMLLRDVANVLMDMDDVEAVTINAEGGSDTIRVRDLSGTDVTEVNINLALSNGTEDAQPDTIIIDGTSANDAIWVVGNASGVSVFGLSSVVNITGFDSNDRIVINGLAGDDVIEAGGLQFGAIQLTADGGAGNDVLIGGGGNDILFGGAGDDVLIGGPGIDILDGSGGDNVVIQVIGTPQPIEHDIIIA